MTRDEPEVRIFFSSKSRKFSSRSLPHRLVSNGITLHLTTNLTLFLRRPEEK